MELSRETLKQLVDSAFDRHQTTLLHGTSIEAVIQLVNTGNLPSSYHEKLPDNSFVDHLFFVPNKPAFVGHGFYHQIKIGEVSKPTIHDYVRVYARNNGFTHYFLSQLAFIPPTDPQEIFDPLINKGKDKFIGPFLAVAKQFNMGIQELEEVAQDAQKRRGVVVGLNKLVFELNIEDSPDIPGYECMIHLPHGLDAKYIQFIQPLGNQEKMMLDVSIR